MELRDDKVRLRPLRYRDSAWLMQLADNIKIWKNLRDMFPHPYTMQDAEKFLDSVKQQDPPITFAIEDDYEFAGVIGLVLQQDVYRKSAEIGYWIGEPFWNKGIASKAVGLVCEYAFEILGLQRLFAGIFEGNTASMRVLERNGFQLEGIGRMAVFKNNKFLDEYRYGKLRSDK